MNRCQNGQGCALGADHQNHRTIGDFRYLVRAGTGSGQTHAVIVAHNTLNDAHILGLSVFRQQIPQGVLPEEVQIQIGTFRTDDPAVEHGVNIVRAAFECTGFQSTIDQCL